MVRIVRVCMLSPPNGVMAENCHGICWLQFYPVRLKSGAIFPRSWTPLKLCAKSIVTHEGQRCYS